MKRLVVGGFERVFEINRNFRNEGVSTRHNPEFTMLEFYQAYADYRDLMDMTEALFREIGTKVLGSLQFTYQDHEIDLSQPFTRMTMKESILKFNPDLTAADLDTLEAARKTAAKLEISVQDAFGLGKSTS